MTVSPVVFKMNGFSRLKELDKKWFSIGFYTKIGGYKARLLIYLNGDGIGKSTHMSVYISLMPGASDDNLQYPLVGKFTIELLNQLKHKNHHTDCFIVRRDVCG